MIIKPSASWHTRSTLSRLAHILERTGLALLGAACGLFVAEVGRFIEVIGSGEVVFAMIIYGATGFYLGIDLPQVPADYRMHLPLWRGLGNSADMVELLTAAGTFITSVTAITSVSSIILGETVGTRTASIICLSWAIGATMQIAAGIIARIELGRAVKMAKLALFSR
ncbi:hypothetical protein [Tardiphaga sp. 813_E8_N1_3]|jgi:hypothetical protein|uniref:hypothetical protein n=1 Tax=Tardiphaga sp. 813_E8_N1_3 TaxID=3240760 RepID=UPI003F1E7142